ncbi:putative PurR-regulated permease PerM [Stella humosa]|uniref:Putative PurR-regulated permease PerM n=1 Tax=Stella humosa TaxID=94 RepID=A0A3N1KIC1_9PROT|nr:AI-2E family transporter [Stella humosa]ROP81303.1 putative PurR-regulated permease PerM [Stella humosa]BBK32652.1 ABC transporter permease [Stella humosa]
MRDATPPRTPLATPLSPAPPAPLVTAGAVLVTIGALYLGRDIFIAFALAILLGFLLAPMATRLRRWGLPRGVAVLFSVGLAFVVVAAITVIVGNELYVLATNIPDYQQTIRAKLAGIRESTGGSGVFERLSQMASLLGRELGAAPVAPGADDAVAVVIQPPPPQPLAVLENFAGPAIAAIASAGLVIVFLFFVLLEREDLRDRLIRLLGVGQVLRSTQALDEAGRRVSRYLVMQLIVNASYGVPIGIGLYLIGVPNALLWGLLAAVLRFIPYLGPFIAALFPITLAFAIDPGWGMLAWTVALFLVLEVVSNNVLEPLLYGSSTGISSLAIIMAAIFWATLWGPVGLLLATPLTVCIVVIGRYVPQLEFLGILLGNDPVLAPEQRFYQRLVAGNHEEAMEVAEDYLEDSTPIAFYQEVVLPALQMTENDHDVRLVDADLRRLVAERVERVLTDLDDDGLLAVKAEDPEADEPVADAAPRGRIVCLAGRTPLDAVAAGMLARWLSTEGRAAEAVAGFDPRAGSAGFGQPGAGDVVALCYLQARPQTYARYVGRRLRRLAPEVRILLVALNSVDDMEGMDRSGPGGPTDGVVLSLAAAVQQINAWSPAADAEQVRLPPAAAAS